MNNNSTTKYCGRCKAKIECLADNIMLCDCNKVNIANDTSAFLKQTNYDCLCNNCLRELDELIKKSKMYRFPESRAEMIEGTHYYVENGYFVFTALYHVLRGKCCQSGCRHCAYGYKNS